MSTLYEMREVVILFEPLARLGEDGMELSSQTNAKPKPVSAAPTTVAAAK